MTTFEGQHGRIPIKIRGRTRATVGARGILPWLLASLSIACASMPVEVGSSRDEQGGGGATDGSADQGQGASASTWKPKPSDACPYVGGTLTTLAPLRAEMLNRSDYPPKTRVEGYYLYYADNIGFDPSTPTAVYRLKRDGSTPFEEFVSRAKYPALDEQAALFYEFDFGDDGTFYWAAPYEQNGGLQIWRLPPGGQPERLYAHAAPSDNSESGYEFVVGRERIFFEQKDRARAVNGFSANESLHGLYSLPLVGGVAAPFGTATSVAGWFPLIDEGHVYWLEKEVASDDETTGNTPVKRAALDGSGRKTLRSNAMWAFNNFAQDDDALYHLTFGKLVKIDKETGGATVLADAIHSPDDYSPYLLTARHVFVGGDFVFIEVELGELADSPRTCHRIFRIPRKGGALEQILAEPAAYATTVTHTTILATDREGLYLFDPPTAGRRIARFVPRTASPSP